MPASLRPIDIIQLTDLHLVADPDGLVRGVNGRLSFARVLALARATTWPPDLILLTGDVSDDGTVASYRNARALLEGIAPPIYFVPGNHDEPAVLRDTLPGGAIRSDRVIDIGVWRLVLLDSHLPPCQVPGRLADNELRHLESSLATARDRHMLVCLHHNPIDIGSSWFVPLGVQNADALWAIVDRFPMVRVVLFAHVHQDVDLHRGAVRMLASPSTSAQFKPGTDALVIDDLPPGFRTLRLFADGTIETAVHRIG